jgi:copper chaperone CopZ
MSRRRGEFEHRTSIFEGAFRAWSHLGGLDPEELETRPASDMDPLTNPIADDVRLHQGKERQEVGSNPDGSRRPEYPYEPLPRTGLAHPYVQAILSPWLGPDADHDAIQLGLTTLRTWWQHRRKGESGTAIAALATGKMSGVIEGYTRHFFNLSHCLVVTDKEQPPRSLHAKMKELERVRNKRTKKRAREEEAGKLAALAINAGISHSAGGGFNPSDPTAVGAAQDVDDDIMSPLERLHAAQRRQLRESQNMYEGLGMPQDINGMPLISMKGQCMPGKIDLPSVVSAVNYHATQLAHRGGNGQGPNAMGSGNEHGDPNTTPVVFVSHNGDIQIAMSVDGITCAHCVKIVETVLKGCNGNKSPIDGLLDAAADRVLCKVLMKIERSSSAKRIAFEATRNLAMVGYTARPMEMSIVSSDGDKKATMDLGALSTAFEVVATTDPQDVFDWSTQCTCPDNGILRDDCSRYV